MKKRFPLFLPNSLWEKARQKAFEKRISLSEYIRQAIEEKLGK